MFAALYTPGIEDAPALLACAREFSPRIEAQLGGCLVLIDVAGLGRIVGDAHAIHAELGASALRAGARRATVAVAPARVAALLLAVAGRDDVVPPGRTRAAVGVLDLAVFDALASFSNRSNPSKSRPCPLCGLAGARRLCGQPGGACTELPTLHRWGLETLADLAALPAAALSARLGQAGVILQRLSRGLDRQPLVPAVEEARFEASLDLEWPIEEIQPLSFALTRLIEPLSAALERADRAAAAIVTELTLVRLASSASMDDAPSHRHVRRLELPAPMRDPRVLRTLIVLDLESHPPQAGVDRVSIRIEPTPGRITQFSLLERAGPQPEAIATLVARLTAVMGEGRVGSPALVDSHAPDAFVLTPFVTLVRQNPPEPSAGTDRQRPAEPASGSVLRRFRLPVAARVVRAGDRLVRVTTDRVGIRGGDVLQCAGPWRSSGGWWSACGPREPRAERAGERARAGVGSPRALEDASACGPREPRAERAGEGARAGVGSPRALEDASACGPREPRAERAGEGARAGVGSPRALEDASAWDRDEYDAALADGAVYRVCRDRDEDRWFIEGVLD